MRFGFIAGTSEARERVAVATLVDGVGADQRAGRAGAVHGELVGDRIRIVLVEPEKVELLGWLGFLCRIVTKAGMKNGRASWRERGCQYVSISVVAVSLKKK